MVKVFYRRPLERARLFSSAKKSPWPSSRSLIYSRRFRSGLFFSWRDSRWSCTILQDVMGGCKALRGSLGYLRVQISGRASSKVKAVYSTRVKEEQDEEVGDSRLEEDRERRGRGEWAVIRRKDKKVLARYYVVWERMTWWGRGRGVLGSRRLLRAPITGTPLHRCYLSRYWWSTESRLMILTPSTNYGRHRVPAEEVGLYREIPFATSRLDFPARACVSFRE